MIGQVSLKMSHDATPQRPKDIYEFIIFFLYIFFFPWIIYIFLLLF